MYVMLCVLEWSGVVVMLCLVLCCSVVFCCVVFEDVELLLTKNSNFFSQEYQDYLEMEKRFLEELGLRETDNDL